MKYTSEICAKIKKQNLKINQPRCRWEGRWEGRASPTKGDNSVQLPLEEGLHIMYWLCLVITTKTLSELHSMHL